MLYFWEMCTLSLLSVYSEEVMSCEVVCVLKICPLWQTLYQNVVVKVEKTDEIKVKMLLGKQKQVVGKEDFREQKLLLL